MEAFRRHSQVNVIHIDFSKNFDRVCHEPLIKLLLKFGFGKPLLSWFRAYLNDRKQCVKINSVQSDYLHVSSK